MAKKKATPKGGKGKGKKAGKFSRGKLVPPVPPNPEPYDPATRPLDEDEFLFVREYLVDRCGARAYRRLFPSASMENSYKMSRIYLARSHVKREIELEILAQGRRCLIRADKVLQEVAGVAMSDPVAWFDCEDNPLPVRAIDYNARKGLKVRVTRYKDHKGQDRGSVVSYEPHEKTTALKELIDHLGLRKNPLSPLEVMLQILPPAVGNELRKLMEQQVAPKPSVNGHAPPIPPTPPALQETTTP